MNQASPSVSACRVKAGVWSDFNSGERGDAPGLVAAVLFAGNVAEAMRRARRWLGMDEGFRACVPPAPERASDALEAERAANRQRALALFAAAREPVIGTPPGEYLAARGLDLGELGHMPRALRFHPS